jgi:RNA polymerase sigma-70 factor (ECF subfamily)
LATLGAQPAAAERAEPEEARWIAGLRGGDAEAFERLYRRRVGALYGLARRLTADVAQAEELVQEVFVRAWERRERFHNVAHFVRWLRQVAIHTWINQLRRARPEAFDDDGGADLPAPPPPPPGARLDLERALARLPPGLRTVLVLFDVYGLSHHEISGHLGISAGASKVQLHRARRRLKEMLR